jgi:hypothetical protein
MRNISPSAGGTRTPSIGATRWTFSNTYLEARNSGVAPWTRPASAVPIPMRSRRVTSRPASRVGAPRAGSRAPAICVHYAVAYAPPPRGPASMAEVEFTGEEGDRRTGTAARAWLELFTLGLTLGTLFFYHSAGEPSRLHAPVSRNFAPLYLVYGLAFVGVVGGRIRHRRSLDRASVSPHAWRWFRSRGSCWGRRSSGRSSASPCRRACPRSRTRTAATGRIARGRRACCTGFRTASTPGACGDRSPGVPPIAEWFALGAWWLAQPRAPVGRARSILVIGMLLGCPDLCLHYLVFTLP